MLVLTRRAGESIQIGDNITITVTKIKGKDTVSVGIDAPKSVRILRQELSPFPETDLAETQLGKAI